MKKPAKDDVFPVDPNVPELVQTEELAGPSTPGIEVKDRNDINMDSPTEGDAYVDERGDLNVYKNATWTIYVGNGAATF